MNESYKTYTRNEWVRPDSKAAVLVDVYSAGRVAGYLDALYDAKKSFDQFHEPHPYFNDEKMLTKMIKQWESRARDEKLTVMSRDINAWKAIAPFHDMKAEEDAV